ncbi:MAG: hypothetical protein A3K03_07235 [Bdellovibrionales bacterium RIFOXYD1_FULL_44_7]|nr:MAG: hypothetical protein A3K03_07235 [Bdellovibrionales bacterium RIFOXYD1_FULL_44_7]
MDNYSLGKKLIINSDDLDFLHDQDDFDYIARQILGVLDQRDLFLEARAVAPAITQVSSQLSSIMTN